MEQIFEVGDRVFDVIFQQWGQIQSVPQKNSTIISVTFNDLEDDEFNRLVHYQESDAVPRLYYQEMTIVPKDSLQRVVQVRDHVNDNWEQRVLIKSLPNETVLCWCNAETINEAKDKTETTVWALWRELPTEPQKVKLTRAEIAEKLGIDIDQLEITD